MSGHNYALNFTWERFLRKTECVIVFGSTVEIKRKIQAPGYFKRGKKKSASQLNSSCPKLSLH